MNILVFTNHYPFKYKDSTATKVVHHYTKEWVKQGNRVIVVHNHIELVSNFSKSNIRISDSYTIEGVEVLYCPINRYIPKSKHIFNSEINKVKNTILTYLDMKNFTPDRFVVHFCVDQWQLVKAIKGNLGCRPIPIFHNCDVKSKKNIKEILASVNKLGYRSEKIRKKILSNASDVNHLQTFQVFSGAPDYIYKTQREENEKSYGQRNRPKILYAGNLIPLKNVDITLKALSKVKDEYNFEFIIIGSGKDKNKLEKLSQKLKLDKRVTFLPRMNRDEILEYMNDCDCFVMVSHPETLGIVYLEAMANKCFIIGSKNEGIDGIISNEESGLLVKPENVRELERALLYYFNLEAKQKKAIIEKAYKISLKYKESSVAKEYLRNLV